MPYNNSTGIISINTATDPDQGISIYDIQQALGIGLYNDIGGLITYGAANNKINKWAKYKPIRRSELHFSDQLNSDKTWKSTATWWKGTNGQCGLTFTTYSNIGSQTIGSTGFLHDLITTSPSWGLAWGYQAPVGGIGTSPFRMFDFLQYYSFAQKPVIGVYDNLRISSSGDLTVQIDENRGDAYTVQLSDLTISNSAVSGWYVGILIYKTSSQFQYAFSTNTIGGNGSLDIDFTGMTSYGGQTVKIVPFLSSVRWNQGGTETTGTFLSCDVEPQDILIRASVNPVDTTIFARWKDSLHVRVTYAVNIINNTGTQLSVSNLRISLYENNVEIDYDTVASITIARDEAHEESGILILDNTTYDSSNTYKVVVTSSTSGVSGEEIVNDPRT